jgi:hypothetical protein
MSNLTALLDVLFCLEEIRERIENLGQDPRKSNLLLPEQKVG